MMVMMITTLINVTYLERYISHPLAQNADLVILSLLFSSLLPPPKTATSTSPYLTLSTVNNEHATYVTILKMLVHIRGQQAYYTYR